jgi:DNA-binding helix-turn-helix protein
MIRNTIKEVMKLRKIKQKELAEFIGITKGTMSAFLAGRINLGLDKIEMIFEYLDIKLVIE